MKDLLISFLLLVVLGGCVASSPKQSLTRDNEEINRGRRYFLRECGRCHGLIYPEERSRDEWQKILRRKRAKVSLTGEQFADLSKFVFATAEK
ncbi:MAG: hypothetical protein ABFS09_05970 [Thermodesulfobacteriota bacterium]